MNNGFVVSFEGIDTCGKSTQVDMLRDTLSLDGYKVKQFHFPMYERPIGNLIGSILKGNVNSDISIEAMQMLYVADQRDFQKELQKYKDEGYIIILDRYDLSTIVYYSMMKGKTLDGAMKVIYEQWQQQLMKPDLTIFLHLNAETVIERKKDLDLFESNFKAMEKASENYFALATTDILSDRQKKIIGANNPVGDIADIIYKEVKDSYGKHIKC